MSGFRNRLLAVPLALALVASPALAAYNWGLDCIDSRSCFFDGVYMPSTGNQGLGYTIWVIGTGIDVTHSEFGDRAQQVVNFAGGPNEDTNGHGTWVASIAGGSTFGVAPHAQLRGVKVIDGCGQTNPDWIVAGIEYVQYEADGSSVAVIPFAFETNPEIDRAINNLVNSGVPVAVAAGDERTDACDLSPARASEAVTVGAHDSSEERTSWSAYGGCIEIYAPGESITGAWHTSDTATNTLSGTAASAAFVAGALTLYGKSASALLNNATPMGGWEKLYV